MDRRWLLGVSAGLLGLFGYEVVRSWTFDELHLPGIPGGLAVLTLIVTAFSLTHCWYSVGGRLTAAFFGLSAVISWALEQFGVVTGLLYGGYHYTDYLGVKVGQVPVLIPLAWFMMIYPSYAIANLALTRRAVGTPQGLRPLVSLAVASALTMTLWDLVIDPILSGPDVRAWAWESGGEYFGVPAQNYVGWFLTTLAVYLAYRRLEQRRAADVAAVMDWRVADWRVAGMPVLAYLLMLLGDLSSGVTPAGLFVVGPIVMGVPIAFALIGLVRMRKGSIGEVNA